MSSPPEFAELLYWVAAPPYSWSVPFVSSAAFGSDGRSGAGVNEGGADGVTRSGRHRLVIASVLVCVIDGCVLDCARSYTSK